MPHALIVDDDVDTLAWIATLAATEGYTVATAESLRQARAQLARQMPELLITDLHLPDGRGLELVPDLDIEPGVPRRTEVVFMTGRASLDTAIEAVRLHAADYLVKPVDPQRLITLLRHPGAVAQPTDVEPRREELRNGRFGHMVGESPPMRALYEAISRVAPTGATVLLTGESGTGKELAARTIHELSRRRPHPFLAINCGAVAPNLVESELFGHEKGSFTGADSQHRGFFEQARGGTVFLDEVTEMPRDLQVKLLRVLETGSFMRVGSTEPMQADVRIIAATNRAPDRAVAEGRFREDLFHRLNVFPIRLPPLRERGADIELLARQFLREMNRDEGTAKTFAPAALARLYAMPWPGNVRQLRNHVQRAYILADDEIEDVDAPPPTSAAAAEDGQLVVIRVGTPLVEVERRVTMATLAQCGQVKRTAARVLGISLKTLYNRLEAYARADRQRSLAPVREPATLEGLGRGANGAVAVEVGGRH